MNRKRLQAAAPAIAIAAIVAGYLVAQRVMAPAAPGDAGAGHGTEGTHGTNETGPPGKPDAPQGNAGVPLQEPSPAHAWPFYHGSADLRGQTGFEVPAAVAERWRHLAEGAVLQPPVADALGLYAATDKGQVVALTFEGAPRWTTPLTRTAPGGAQRPAPVEAPPAVIDGTVYAGSSFGVLHALDAATGALRWTYDTGGAILGTVNVFKPADGPARLFVLEQAEGVLHRIDPATGAPLWKSEPISRADGSPAAGDGAVVFGSCAEELHVFDPMQDRLLRNIPLGGDGQVAGGPALADGRIYAGTHSGAVYCAEAGSARMLWTNRDAQQDVLHTPAVGADRVVFASEDGNVYAVERQNGERRWTFATRGAPMGPVIAGGTVLVSASGVLHALALDTGAELWKHEVGDAISAPAISGGLIVVGSEDGSVVAFGAAG